MNTTHTTTPSTLFDVVVVGGGAAGLAAAEALGRARRSVAVIDSGEPRNGVAAGVHKFLTRDGTPPAELLRLARDEVRRYGVVVGEGSVQSSSGSTGDFALTLTAGTIIRGRRLLLATGGFDELPEVEGLRERWGREVLHCPYCHGWEVQDDRLGILATTAFSAHQALMFRQWSDRIVYFEHTAPPLTDDQRTLFAAQDIAVVTGQVNAARSVDDRLHHLLLADGSVHALDALVVSPFLRARVEPFAALGVEAVLHESGMGTAVTTDAFGRTEVPGIWAAGNVTELSAQVIVSAAAGLMAGAHINADLTAEDQAAAIRRSASRTVVTAS
ncbi:NAD(P)/FAD-dependent oxidoreductase [Subtercola boreus]|uniref:FAD/NAD(P)-binding domain-containing protein n=1 Tax=Subtercola boreus TaxID=120213 RepID=A0A3E0W981_9MICO|nr:NAD(P)/FAD-dependent oxidoreductase [Subtercola boreus]RFA20059.1 hypothetical protein B7R24_10825 [Subtercola boreus]RFA20189.1 hypothetical protein B7R23_10765 [Subtercola boreus]RFA26515.1 hypothetical protein B7R25_10890 [Subtercola boreus]